MPADVRDEVIRMTDFSDTVVVVVPTTGRSTVRAAVESVRRQTVPTEIVVVLDKPEEYENLTRLLRDFDCNIICTPGLKGGAYARNFGADAAISDYIAFLDDDDWWVRDKLERQLGEISGSGFDKNQFVLSGTAMVFHRATDSIVIPDVPLKRDSEPVDYLVQRPRLRYGTYALQTSSLLLTRILYQEVRWNASLPKHQDWDFIARALAVPGANFVWVDEPVVHVMQGSAGSISRTPNWRASLDFLEKYSDRMSRRGYADFLHTQVLRSALAARDLEGVKASIRQMRGRIPHTAAALVGLSGLREGRRSGNDG